MSERSQRPSRARGTLGEPHHHGIGPLFAQRSENTMPPRERQRPPTTPPPDASSLATRSYLARSPSVVLHEGLAIIDRGHIPRNDPRRRHWRRGCILRYSSPSRRRMMRLMATIRHNDLTSPLFLTLTYHAAPDDAAARTDLHTYLRILRLRWPSLQYLWRMELQRRGAIHWHVILWLHASSQHIVTDARMIPHLRRVWHQLVGSGDPDHERYGAKIALAASRKQAYAYISKYVAKEDADPRPVRGRRWATSRGLPTAPYYDVDVTYHQQQVVRRIVRRLMRARLRKAKRLGTYIAHCRLAYVYVRPPTMLRILRGCARVTMDRIHAPVRTPAEWQRLAAIQEALP